MKMAIINVRNKVASKVAIGIINVGIWVYDQCGYSEMTDEDWATLKELKALKKEFQAKGGTK